MIINFNNVTPAPLAGVIDLNTTVWQNKCLFEKGHRYRITAPSGKGKSTFIHLIYGLRFDYEGEVAVNYQSVKEIDANQWADIRQKEISIVFQDLRLFLNLTAIENIKVKSLLSDTVDDVRIFAMAKRLGIEQLLEKKCSTLSYGERQRIAIIRALVQPFSLILLDEPFSHLDKANSEIAAALINEEIEARGAGLIITSLGQDNYFSIDKEFQL